ncbi:glycoside hydrolase family 18 protein [Dissophora ornata]|nr:Chitinase 1 [Dissophora ornata]KAI8600456.1 glycoside hydrolase family 18 protein [Dissophora ornata]
MKSNLFTLCAVVGTALMSHSVSAFSALSKTNVVNYWGQNSVSSVGGTETDLVNYCQDDTVDVFVVAFVYQIQNNMPVLNLANHCGDTFSNGLLNCPKVGQDIKACQANGKKVIISVGGATGAYSLPDAASGQAFADNMWDTFLGGSSSTRPFGDAIVDGVDLDLESGSNAGYVQFIASLRTKFAAQSSKNYYITSAPQCPYPDQATQAALASSWFDMVWVQFYNNYCGVQSYGTGNFNFDTWNNWATSVSLNKDVRILLGVPGGPGGAGSGVISASTLNTILNGIKSYSNFGGVMMWDAGIAQQSGLAASAAQFLHGSITVTTTVTTTATATATATKTITATTVTATKTITTTAPATSTTPAGSGSCAGVAAWDSSKVYATAGTKVTYNGHLWTNQWWTQGDTPSGVTWSVWVDGGAC